MAERQIVQVPALFHASETGPARNVIKVLFVVLCGCLHRVYTQLHTITHTHKHYQRYTARTMRIVRHEHHHPNIYDYPFAMILKAFEFARQGSGLAVCGFCFCELLHFVSFARGSSAAVFDPASAVLRYAPLDTEWCFVFRSGAADVQEYDKTHGNVYEPQLHFLSFHGIVAEQRLASATAQPLHSCCTSLSPTP